MFIHFNITLSLIYDYTLKTSLNMTIRILKVKGHVSTVLLSCVFTHVQFLHFDELKMRFLDIVPFVYRKYILNIFECFLCCGLIYTYISKFLHVIGTNMLTGHLDLYFGMYGNLFFNFRVFVRCFCSFKISTH